MMHNDDEYTEAWLGRLDSIIAGEDVPSASDDELLHLAGNLVKALEPFQEMRRAAGIGDQRLPSHLRVMHAKVTRKSVKRLSLSSLLVATLLLLVLAVGIVSTGGLTTLWAGATQVWHASTSLDQINGISVASLSRPHAGLKPLPLLPAVLPSDTQGSSYGVITDASNPNLLITFVADYRIAGQDVFLYEQPSGVPFTSSTAKTVRIGALEGQWFQDDTGTNALQWYQHGMVCQVTSKLPVERLVELASIVQPIKNWDLLL